MIGVGGTGIELLLLGHTEDVWQWVPLVVPGGRGGRSTCWPIGWSSCRSSTRSPRDRAAGAKKNDLQPHIQVGWVIPPTQDGEYVACMEDVLAVYQQPPSPTAPLVCMDERPVQLVNETRCPVPAAPGRPRRVDYESERAGTANLFLFTEPPTGWRQVTATARRTKVDWAVEIRTLLDGRYAEAEQVVLVLDNLNTHTRGALNEAFPPAEARRLAERVEFRYTPKHGSWLNIA